MNYQLVKGPDGTIWVSLQPLRDDVISTLDKLEKIDVTDLSALDKDIMNFNILGMKAIATFLNSLEQESQLKDLQDEKSTRPSVH